MKVVASYITPTYIIFSCPHCRTKYKKNGDPYKNSKVRAHRHGSNNDLTNRTETRVPHCDPQTQHLVYDWEFEIEINDDTIRLPLK